MKKRMLALLLSALILATATGCQHASEIPTTESKNIENTDQPKDSVGEDQNESLSQNNGTDHADVTNQSSQNEHTSAPEEAKKVLSEWATDPKWKQHDYFLANVDQNPYDQWWKAADGSPDYGHPLYPCATYMDLWLGELTYTAESGKEYFTDTEAYELWKYQLEQFAASVRETVTIENSLMRYKDPRFSILFSACRVIRQKTIDAKNFLCHYGTAETGRVTPLDAVIDPPLSKIDPAYLTKGLDQNPYDDWLVAELAAENASKQNLYAQYCTLWEHEMPLILEYGQGLFSSAEQYEQWKNSLEQFMTSARELFEIEWRHAPSEEQQLQVLISYAQLIRDKVLDEVFFLRQYESDLEALEILNRVPETKG